MSIHSGRLTALRQELAARGLDGFVVPLTDEHLSEYVGDYAQRLSWLSGFGGSAGTGVVLAHEAAIFVDGRYTLQVREQVDGTEWSYQPVPEASAAGWLAERVLRGARIGYDPWLHTIGWVEATRAALAARGAELVPVDGNPIDAVWPERPAPSDAVIAVHDERYAGQSAAAKRAAFAETLTAGGQEAVVLSALDSIAWAFNVRGSDVARTPVAKAWAIVHADATADLFIDEAKLIGEVRTALGNAVRVHDLGAFERALDCLAGQVVALDRERTVAAIFERLRVAGAMIIEAPDPALLPKAIKNDAEIAGARAAHARDGAALVRFLHWFDEHAAHGALTEIRAADRLEAFRREHPLLRDLAFDTISGAGPSGAVVHYRVSPESDRRIDPDSLFLLDSGGQYADGTTDVTRTMAVGTPTAEMRDRFTRVLKGHVALATAVFPTGTKGGQLDALARRPLWEAGLDYAHGTGHGVGSYLGVHEGPQRIANAGDGGAPLRAGMILSNEPGYYKTGAYGIRIENLMLVEARAIAGAEKPMLGFETLTLAPIDRRLIEVSLLTPAERDWVDAYHARTLATLSPALAPDARAWLTAACAPLE